MKVLMSLAVLAGLALQVNACNIPVFRYSLERWKPDNCEVIVFHDGELTKAEEAWVRQLEKQSVLNNGSANAKIVRANVQTESNEWVKSLRFSIGWRVRISNSL